MFAPGRWSNPVCSISVALAFSQYSYVHFSLNTDRRVAINVHDGRISASLDQNSHNQLIIDPGPYLV